MGAICLGASRAPRGAPLPRQRRARARSALGRGRRGAQRARASYGGRCDAVETPTRGAGSPDEADGVDTAADVDAGGEGAAVPVEESEESSSEDGGTLGGVLRAAQERVGAVSAPTVDLFMRGITVVRDSAVAVTKAGAETIAGIEVDKVRFLVLNYARDWRRQAREEGPSGIASEAAMLSGATTMYEEVVLGGETDGEESDSDAATPAFDREALAPFLETVGVEELRAIRKCAAMSAMTYELPDITRRPESMRRMYGLKLVAHSLEKKHATAAAAALKKAKEEREIERRKEELMATDSFGYVSARASWGKTSVRANAADGALAMRRRKGARSGEPTDTARDTKQPSESASAMERTIAKFFAKAIKEQQEEAPQPVEWFAADEEDTNVRYIVIQGSQTLAHWKTNMSFDPVPFEGCLDVSAHRGFYESAMEMYDIVRPTVLEHLNSPPKVGKDGRPLPPRVGFTGHSLGGAIAVLLALILHKREEGRVTRDHLAPVYTMGSPQAICGAHNGLMGRTGSLPASMFRSVMMHRDIVPRALACYYPDAVTRMLANVNDKFGTHECLACHSMLFAPIGRMYLLQPPLKMTTQHPLLPEGMGLHMLSTPGSSVHQLANAGERAGKAGRWTPPTTIVGPARNASGLAVDVEAGDGRRRGQGAAQKRIEDADAPAGDEGDAPPPLPPLAPAESTPALPVGLSCSMSSVGVASAVSAAERAFLNSPHPLDILADAGAYGPEGHISRHHNPDNYTRALSIVLQKSLRERREGRVVLHGEGGAPRRRVRGAAPWRRASARAAEAAATTLGRAKPSDRTRYTAKWLARRYMGVRVGAADGSGEGGGGDRGGRRLVRLRRRPSVPTDESPAPAADA